MPPLNNGSILMYFIAFILLYLTYVAYSYRNRIWCTFRRADRTKIEKWAKPDQNRIDFDGGWYHVEPARTVIQWKMVLGFFPMPVRALDFRHGSARALHPDSFDSSFSAEERKQLDKTDNLKGLQIASEETLRKQQKKGMLEQYMPFIVIGGFAILGYFVYQQQHRLDMLGLGQNAIEAMLAKLLAR